MGKMRCPTFRIAVSLASVMLATLALAVAVSATTPPAPVIGQAVAASDLGGAYDARPAGDRFGLQYSGCGGVVPAVIDGSLEQRIVEITNLERLYHGNLPPLKRAVPLDEAARYHSVDMRDDDYFQHDSYDRSGGSLVLTCDWVTRVTSYYPSASSVAENIAAGYTTPGAVILGWLNSPPHKDNLLRTTVREIGVGYACCGGTYTRYWTQDFGTRSGVYPLVINRDDGTTTSANVTVYIYGTWSEMRLRNDGGTWTAWLPFSNEFAWALPAGAGTHTVTGEMRTVSTAATSSDTIELVTGAPTVVPTSMSTGTVTVSPSPSATRTRTPTAVPPTATRTRTPTVVPPTATRTRTPTVVPATATRTRTPTGPAPTATQTRTRTATSVPVTATRTRTATTSAPTATRTRTPTTVPPTTTRTRTPTTVPGVPSKTPTAPGGAERVVYPVHDALTNSISPNMHYGLLGFLLVKGGRAPVYRSYVKFVVPGLPDAVRGAILRLYVIDGTPYTTTVYRVGNTYARSSAEWTETGIAWSNQPEVAGAPLASFGPVSAWRSVDVDVASAVTGAGTYSFALVTTGEDPSGYRSRQAANLLQRPRLTIRTAGQ